ncbi:galactose oxidase [Chitinophaga silvatica]|uniref:Galactose oxidase n=1 Tax=Chitinophaga silvatica TaxID=2282649 RepID=A0A3E1YHR3_9BACT|nr:galactose oxidase [Chitinophaga silvatica]RFS26963.1 galactose oxidase [Chitinophaga silvatica]
MRKFILLLFIHIHLVTISGFAQSYGLRFSSHEVVQEKRTTLNLSSSGPLCFKKNTEISFDLNFIPYKETYFGYIFRTIDANNQNIDLVYNQRERTFNFVIGESFSKTFLVDSVALHNKWVHFAIKFDLDNQSASILVNDKLVIKGPAKFGSSICERIFFGTNSFEGFQTVDIPPMNIRNIQIKEGDKLKYNWPLSENEGNTATDTKEGKIALIKNANWIGPRHQSWKPVHTWEIQGNPSVAFDKNNEVLYIVSSDTLYSISFKSEQQKAIKLTQRLDSLMPGSQSVYNPYNDKLYNFYIDQKKIGAYDTTSRRWDINYTPDLLTIYWQANKFVSKADSSLYILCGYGQMQYKNTVQRYQFSTKQWDSIPVRGERLTPRYMAAVGANEDGDTAYILGGYGSNSGNQVVNPRHYYDLFAFSVKDHSFSKIYQFPEPPEQFCFANSMVIDPETHNYYALIFPNDKFNTSLQLIEGNFHEPNYRLLGNSIPYSFHDIKSFADLYYCKESNKLVAVTLYTSKDNITEVKAYSLEFPPNALASSVVPAKSISHWYYLLLIPAGIIILMIFRKKKPIAIKATAPVPKPVNDLPVVKKEVVIAPVHEAPVDDIPVNEVVHTPVVTSDTEAIISETDKRGQVFFFGPFEVLDKDGQDITRFFTPLLKELFLLISIHTIRSGKGISSDRLYATLWRDKSNKEAQNNRSVNMVKLKAILDKLGVCSFVKEADRWSLQYDASEIRMDLADFQQWIQGPRPLTRQGVKQLLQLLHRGSFLPDANYIWLEDIQSEISNISLDILTESAAQFKSDPELLIEIADSIFLFDPVNEEALRMKCSSLVGLGRHSLAKAAFNKFAKEYNHMYGEEFPHAFNEYSVE